MEKEVQSAKREGARALFKTAKERACGALRLYAVHLRYMIDYAGELYLDDPVAYELLKLAMLEENNVQTTLKALCGTAEPWFKYIDRGELGEIYYKLVEKIWAALPVSGSYLSLGSYYQFVGDYLVDEEDDVRSYKRAELELLLGALGIERDGTKMVVRRDVAEFLLEYLCSQLRRHYIAHEEDLPRACRK
jgi:hypothetical protein